MKDKDSEVLADSIFGERCLIFAKKILERVGGMDIEMSCRPSIADVFQLSELAFLLSTIHEESCFVSCRLGIVEDEMYERLIVEDSDSFLRFAEPIEFGLGKIKKLALASDSSCSMLLIKRDKDGELKVYGIYTFYETLQMVKQLGIKKMNRKGRIFNIHIKEPGSIDACIGNMPLIRWYNGTTITESDEKVIDHCDLLRKKFENEFKHWSSSYYYLAAIELIASYIQELKHGGALLIVDDKAAVLKDGSLKIKYLIEQSISIKEQLLLLHEILQSGAEIQSMKLFETTTWILRKIDALCHFVAHLSRVDGAVVMTQDLAIVGFGAEIIMPKTNSTDSLPYYNLKEDKYGDLVEKGTRHRSAYRFCKTHMSSVAFVISQDGDISIMTKNNIENDKIPLNTMCIYPC